MRNTVLKLPYVVQSLVIIKKFLFKNLKFSKHLLTCILPRPDEMTHAKILRRASIHPHAYFLT
jgi:hypothetical protein